MDRNRMLSGGSAALLPVAFAFSVLASAAAPASAQVAQGVPCRAAVPSNRLIAVGSCIRSAIDAADSMNEDGISYEEWTLQLQAGQTVQVDMEADPVLGAAAQAAGGAQFDTYLELRAPDGSVVAANDDRGDSLNSRIRHTARAAGAYVLRARPLLQAAGAYTLRVAAVRPPPAPTPLAAGRTEGVLTPASEESEQLPGFRVHRYSFDGAMGERVRIRLRSGARTKTMDLGDDRERVIASDQGAEEDLEILAVLPRSGRYVLRLNAGTVEQPTPFVLEFERRQDATAAQPRRIPVGTDVTGEIGLNSHAAADPLDEERQVLTEVFEIAVNPGDVITVTAESTAFDPVLDAGALSPIGFAAAMTNDDSSGTLNSLLVLRAERGGAVQLRVRPLGSGFGPFRLTTRSGRTEAAVAADANYTQLVFIQFAGSITRQEVRAANDLLRAAGWRVQGLSGERIATAAGLNEVRYSAQEDRAAAEALAAALTQARLGSAPVRARHVSIIRPGTLEAWISN
jgi:hypothetical protein